MGHPVCFLNFNKKNECARNGQDEPGLNSLPENVSKQVKFSGCRTYQYFRFQI